mgnify:CR=1 FL=1|tara:strand:- start:963 stop:1202 length:240 start_codon:yes stop_codon:yes gene_type:complete
MSKVCKLTGKKPNVANSISKSHIKTKRRQFPNLQAKKIFVPELNRSFNLKLSTKALKIIDKVGLIPYLNKNNMTLEDIK